MGIGAVAGSKFYIADPGTVVFSDFVEVKNISSLGNIARAFASVNVEEVGSGYTYDLKGPESFPNFELTLNRNNEDPGQQNMLLASQDREVLYNFMLEDPDGGPIRTGAVTVTVATPGVFTHVAHGLAVDDRVVLSTTGALLTGLIAGQEYYVNTTPTADTFTLKNATDGTPVTTSGTQSGVHTFSSRPFGTRTLWKGEVFGFGKNYGGVTSMRQTTTSVSIRPDSVVTIDPV